VSSVYYNSQSLEVRHKKPQNVVTYITLRIPPDTTFSCYYYYFLKHCILRSSRSSPRVYFIQKRKTQGKMQILRDLTNDIKYKHKFMVNVFSVSKSFASYPNRLGIVSARSCSANIDFTDISPSSSTFFLLTLLIFVG
jgi:hypothetical protein